MDINGISSNSGNLSQSSCMDREIQYLQKYKIQLQQKLAKLNASKMDPAIKSEQLNAVNEQIKQVDIQIHQKQMEKMKPKVEADNTKNDTATNKEQFTDTSVSGASSKHLISAVTNYSDLKTLKSVRTELKNQRVASNEYSSVDERIKKVEEKMKDKMNEIDKDLKKVSHDSRKASKVKHNKEAEEISTSEANAKSNDNTIKEAKNNTDKTENLVTIDIRI